MYLPKGSFLYKFVRFINPFVHVETNVGARLGKPLPCGLAISRKAKDATKGFEWEGPRLIVNDNRYICPCGHCVYETTNNRLGFAAIQCVHVPIRITDETACYHHRADLDAMDIAANRHFIYCEKPRVRNFEWN